LPAGAPPAPPKKAAPPPEWAARTDYPMITYSDGDAIKQTAPPPSGRSKPVTFEYLPDGALPDKLQELLSEGGCAGIVLDTVGRAQEAMRILGERFAGTDIELIHSRFLSIDRMQKEKALREKLGPPGRAGRRPERLIVVGSQVLEQSLDIDFDLLVSDIAPMDLLLQRVGRLHRHARARPAKLEEARCFITGVEDANEWKFAQSIEKIYSRYALLNTLLLLPVSPRRVTLPDDISPLVQAAYAEAAEGDAFHTAHTTDRTARAEAEAAMREEKRAAYAEARKAHNERIKRKEEKANVFRLRPPAGASRTLVDWLDIAKSDSDERKAEAAVRDTSDSIEVMVVQKKVDGKICLLPWVCDAAKGVAPGAEIPTERVPKDAVARVAAACTVSLPMLLCRSSRIIDDVIAELESKAIASRVGRWQESFWLRGMLPLILDENLQTEILGHTVSYCDKTGLSVTRKETGTGT
ncbi:MAG: hypothetical protein LBP73_06060, partial [Clostridiales Family XIII bacterium]|nr:hypothetical protein [Clostridiales Family XIII bacterium]